MKGPNLAARLHGLPRLTPSEVNSSVTDNLVMAVIVSLVSVLLWIFVARATMAGQSSVRVTASGLFVIATMVLLIGPIDLGLRGPSRPKDALPLIVWLIGLAAVVLLWRRPSSEFFRGSVVR